MQGICVGRCYPGEVIAMTLIQLALSCMYGVMAVILMMSWKFSMSIDSSVPYGKGSDDIGTADPPLEPFFSFLLLTMTLTLL
jgi:hypothetical protein